MRMPRDGVESGEAVRAGRARLGPQRQKSVGLHEGDPARAVHALDRCDKETLPWRLMPLVRPMQLMSGMGIAGRGPSRFCLDEHGEPGAGS
jgi:hypothetical protein